MKGGGNSSIFQLKEDLSPYIAALRERPPPSCHSDREGDFAFLLYSF